MTTAPPKTLRLTYLDVPGVAESTRLALRVANIAFEDVRVSYDDVGAMRDAGKLPFGQVPILEFVDENGVTTSGPFGQSGATLRYAGMLGGLYPLEPDVMLEVEQVLGGLKDIAVTLNPLWYSNVLPRLPTNGSLLPETSINAPQRDAVQTAVNAVILPTRLAQLERVAQAAKESATARGETGPYLVGSRLSVADLELFVVLNGRSASNLRRWRNNGY